MKTNLNSGETEKLLRTETAKMFLEKVFPSKTQPEFCKKKTTKITLEMFSCLFSKVAIITAVLYFFSVASRRMKIIIFCGFGRCIFTLTMV